MASLGAASASAHSDVIRSVQGYINKILKPKDPSRAVDGMKALLLDRETKTLVSMVYSMHEILSKEGAFRWHCLCWPDPPRNAATLRSLTC